MPRAAYVAMVLVAVLILASGCAKRVHRLVDEKFLPTPADVEVKLFVNEIDRPHIKIAYVQSKGSLDEEMDTRREQLSELRARARRLGADAVVNIRQVSNKVRGFVPDERAPIPAVRPGRYEVKMLRGTAIRFVEEEDLANVEYLEAPAAIEEAPEGTDPLNPPALETRDREDDQVMENAPKGLRITVD